MTTETGEDGTTKTGAKTIEELLAALNEKLGIPPGHATTQVPLSIGAILGGGTLHSAFGTHAGTGTQDAEATNVDSEEES